MIIDRINLDISKEVYLEYTFYIINRTNIVLFIDIRVSLCQLSQIVIPTYDNVDGPWFKMTQT